MIIVAGLSLDLHLRQLGFRISVAPLPRPNSSTTPFRSMSDFAAYKHATFASALGEDFEVRLDSGERTLLKLDEVTEVKTRGAIDSFSVFFVGTETSVLKQATYTLNHTTLGQANIFLVPVAFKDGRAHYQAVFNVERRRGD